MDTNLEELERAINVMIETGKKLEEHNKNLQDTIIKLQLELIEIAKRMEKKR